MSQFHPIKLPGGRKPVLLVVLAHPDDETFGTGGTLAMYARAGWMFISSVQPVVKLVKQISNTWRDIPQWLSGAWMNCGVQRACWD